MSFRIVHVITSKCEIFVEVRSKGVARVRIYEPDSPDPADIEVEGNAQHIAEAFASVAEVLANVDFMDREPN